MSSIVGRILAEIGVSEGCLFVNLGEILEGRLQNVFGDFLGRFKRALVGRVMSSECRNWSS